MVKSITTNVKTREARTSERVRRAGTPGIDPGSSFHTLKISVFRDRKLRFLMMSLTLASDEARSSSDRYKTVRTSAKTRETRASGPGGHAGTSGIDAGSIFEN